MSTAKSPSKAEKALAEVCRNCPVCNRARKNPTGWCGWFVRKVERLVCPACRSYEKVYGTPAHKPKED
jgi:hypothetical protein